jgi:23S rRNA (uridine2552-2'-O)-methyltransferase
VSTKTRWFQERQKEGYYRLAKKEGYRARSAYKLMQINDKYSILRSGSAVADLGCAPGGWSQVLVEQVGQGGIVVGVDLQRVKPIPGARFIQGDFMRRDTHARLTALLAESGRKELDAVVSDMAPDMSGNYELDQVRSVQLGEMALDFARKHLREGGHFACKVFEGADFMAFRTEVRLHFRSVYQYHPPASRSSSSEVYLIAKGFKGKDAAKPADEGGDDPDDGT